MIYDFIVTGSGPTGIVSFYHLKKLNYKVLLIDKKNLDNLIDYPLSLSIESVKILKNIGLWSDNLEVASIQNIKVLNSDKFGSINIDHKEIGLPAFGSVLSNRSFLGFLQTSMLNENGNQFIDDFVVKVSENTDLVEVATKNGRNFKSKFLINCTGDTNLDNSISFFEGDEFNIFTGFCSKKIYESTVVQWFDKNGTLGVIPNKKKSDFIFSAPSHINNQIIVKKNIEKKIAKLNDKNIEIEITQKFKLNSKFLDTNFIGKILHIGKSSHVLPPIAAQGLNLALRDIKCMNLLFKNNLSEIKNIQILNNKYNSLRRFDRKQTKFFIFLLSKSNNSFLNTIFNFGFVFVGSLQKVKKKLFTTLIFGN